MGLSQLYGVERTVDYLIVFLTGLGVGGVVFGLMAAHAAMAETSALASVAQVASACH